MPRKIKDMTGYRNGHIEIIGHPRREGGYTYWRARCDCGHE